MEREDVRKEMLKKAALSLLAMQRHSWEQGTAMQAFLEMGEMDTVCAMAHEAVYRSLPDGRAATIGVTDAVTDPCSVGEALIAACRHRADPMLERGLKALLTWALSEAPRSDDGILYHLTTSRQFWVDSMYMLPPFLAAAGEFAEAYRQMNAYWNALYDRDSGLMSHMWDDENGTYIRRAHWGSGNGWALAGMARLHGLLPLKGYEKEKGILEDRTIRLLKAVLSLLRPDGLFHDVIDDSSTFVETNLSQMTAYTIYRGMAEGWLDPAAYIKEAKLLRMAAEGQMDEFGFIRGVCGAPAFDKPGISPEGQAFYLLMEHAYAKWRSISCT